VAQNDVGGAELVGEEDAEEECAAAQGGGRNVCVCVCVCVCACVLEKCWLRVAAFALRNRFLVSGVCPRWWREHRTAELVAP